jgi:hypothetical protein
MSLPVFLAILVAALLHASWNALVKTREDRFASVLLLALAQGAIAALLIPVFGLPARAAWPWVLLGSALHTGYKLFLVRAYRDADLSQVYPLARGAAPLIVTVASALFLAEVPPPLRIAAVLAIAGGIMLMARGGGLGGTALLWALGTAAFTASYTMADGVGARVAGSASAFAMTMFAIDAGHGGLRLGDARPRRCRPAAARLAERRLRRRDVARLLLDRHLGLHPSAAGDGRRAPRDQRPVRHADRPRPARRAGRARPLGGGGVDPHRNHPDARLT